MSDDAPQKAMRPNDMCTASYYDDVAKLKELLTVPEVEDEPPLAEEFDPAEQPNPDDPDAEEGAGGRDPQEEEEERERAEQREKNVETIKGLLAREDVLTTRLSPVNIAKYGLHLFVEEKDYVCTSRFRTSAKSTIAASPLHWAVLGRAHKAVAFLVSKGADSSSKCPVLGATPAEIAEANGSYETLRVLSEAVALREEAVASEAEAKALRLKTIEDRAAAVKEHYRREAEEERLAAEREAAAEEGEEGDGGDYYGGGEGDEGVYGEGEDDGEYYDE